MVRNEWRYISIHLYVFIRSRETAIIFFTQTQFYSAQFVNVHVIFVEDFPKERNVILCSVLCVFASISPVASAAVQLILVRMISQRGVMKAAPLGPFLSKGSHANTQGPFVTLSGTLPLVSSENRDESAVMGRCHWRRKFLGWRRRFLHVESCRRHNIFLAVTSRIDVRGYF